MVGQHGGENSRAELADRVVTSGKQSAPPLFVSLADHTHHQYKILARGVVIIHSINRSAGPKLDYRQLTEFRERERERERAGPLSVPCFAASHDN